MNVKKVFKFFKMNKYDRALSICRNTYSRINRRKFGNIGKKSYFMSPIFLSGTKYIEMGNDVGIWHNARVEVVDEWNGEKFTPHLIIGDHVKIGQDLHMTCAESIVIEPNVVCTARVTITDINHVTNGGSSVLEQGINTKPVRICEGAFIGVNATILPGVTVGRFAVVGANALVTKDVPDYAVVAGVPAKVLHG